MTAYLVIVHPQEQQFATTQPLLESARALGINVERVAVERRYLIAGAIDADAVQALASDLLSDPVIDEVVAGTLSDVLPPPTHSAMDWAVDVAYRPGVTDNEGESIHIGAARTGMGTITTARTIHRTLLQTGAGRDEVERLARALLANDLVEVILVAQPDDAARARRFYTRLLAPPPLALPVVHDVPLRELDDIGLEGISRNGILSLDHDEMRTIQRYFRDLGRDPTDGELETIAQTWSEHCSHKTFKARIQYQGLEAQVAAPDLYPMLVELGAGQVTIEGLLKHYLVRATERVRKPWLLSAFVDNAGIIAFGDDDALSFKVETHNHPSALEPFGGANTGVGGVVRDVLGVSAQPIANMDVLCFGPLDTAPNELPAAVLHPARVAAGVVAGVRDYGNKLGVPTVTGAVLYDPGYTRNPLVFCGTVGLAKRSAHRQGPEPGDVVVVVGGRTGRDGMHGATFSSAELTHETAETVGAAVQIGDPITEKKVIDVLLQASERGLFRAITDCGAGGLSSAVGELGAETGVTIILDAVPLKYPGLQPWEIWLSEAQERMVVAIPPTALDDILALCHDEDVEATAIGHFTDDQRLTVRYQGITLVDLDMALLHEGRPQRVMEARWNPPAPDPVAAQNVRAADVLRRLLAHPNIASKEDIVRTYDHLVQGRTIQGPLGAQSGRGPTDAAVLQPRRAHPEAIAIGCGINPRYGLIDPYWMALAACDEALRNVVAVGGDPQHCSLLDNFCWGDPREPDRLGGLVRATAGCHDAAVAWGTPFISGKDSLNNEYRDEEGLRVPIPPTLLISALAIVPDLACVTSIDLKEAGNRIYLVGRTRAELGGSHVHLLHGAIGDEVPRVELGLAGAIFRALHSAIRNGLVRACHDISEGGLGVAAAEMAFGGELGLALELGRVPWSGEQPVDHLILWSESPTRFLVEVAPHDVANFEQHFTDLPVAQVGSVLPEAVLRIIGLDGTPIIYEPIADLERIWHGAT